MAIHNGIADIAAGLGIKASGHSEEQVIMDYLADRQAAIERIAFRCQKMLISLLKADAAAREEIGTEARGKKARSAKSPCHLHSPALTSLKGARWPCSLFLKAGMTKSLS